MAIPPIVSGDIVQAVIRYRCENQVMMNVLHYRARVGVADAEYFAIMDELGEALSLSEATGIVTQMLPLLGPNVKVEEIQCQRIFPNRSPYLSYSVLAFGTHADDCDALNVSAVITKRGEKAGRGKAGTFHLGGIASTTYALGQMTTASRTLLLALADKINDPQLTAGGDSLFEAVIFDADGTVGTNYNPIVSCVPQSTLRVVRRRTVGLGI